MKKWYGNAGSSMNQEGFKKKFGESSTASGKHGEVRCENRLKAMRPSGAVGMSSLSLPESRGDVDFVMVKGKNVVLIDAKLWKAGVWSTNNRGSILLDGKVHYKEPSKNMRWAVDQISRLLGPGYNVHAVVMLMPTNGKKKVETKRLRFPGGIPGMTADKSVKYIRRKLGFLPFGGSRTKEAVSKLSGLVQ